MIWSIFITPLNLTRFPLRTSRILLETVSHTKARKQSNSTSTIHPYLFGKLVEFRPKIVQKNSYFILDKYDIFGNGNI